MSQDQGNDMKPSDQDANTELPLSRPSSGSQNSIDLDKILHRMAQHYQAVAQERTPPNKTDFAKAKSDILAWHNTQLKEESIAATFRMMTEYVDSCNDQSDETEGLAIVPSFKGFKKFLEAKLDDMQARYLKEEWHG